LKGNRWVIENQTNNKELVIDHPDPTQSVHLFKCENCLVTVKGKVNRIGANLCHRTAIVFESIIATVEVVNSSSIELQAMSQVPVIQVDKTAGCQIYLAPESLNVEVVTAKSDEVNVYLPGRNNEEDQVELPVPQQFKTTIDPVKRTLTCLPVTHV
jgi:adenylyl cyclase-associated protein